MGSYLIEERKNYQNLRADLNQVKSHDFLENLFL